MKRRRCLRTHPNWMFNHRNSLGYQRLSDLFLPGTHESGSYNKRPPGVEDSDNQYVITQVFNFFF